MSRRRRVPREPDLESLLRLAEQAGLGDDPGVQKLMKRASATENPYLKRKIQKLLTAKAAETQVHPFETDPPSISTQRHRITLGTTPSSDSYRISQDDLTQHLLAVGQSGAGKTTLFYNVMQQLTVPFWAFDLKQDYRHLVHNETLDLLVLPWSKLRFNPLKPPEDVPPRRWAQVFSEMFGHSTALLSGSKNYLMKRVIELYQLYDLLDEPTPPYPSLHELQTLVVRDKINYVRKLANYRDTVQNRLDAMNLTAGTIFNCSEGYPIKHLLDRNVVFEFDGLSTDLQNFLMEILFAYVYEYRVAHNQRGGELRHVFFLDEGKRVFSVYKERQDAAGLPKIDELTAQMREFGEGLVVADQEASKLTDSIKANTDTNVLLPTGDAKQFQEIATSMNLTERQQDLAQQMNVGEAVVRTGNHEPVPVKLDTYDVEKTASTTELSWWQHEAWNRLSYEPRESVSAFSEAFGGESPDEEHATQDEEGGSVEVNELDITLSEDAETLLKDVVENPFTPLTERYELFSSRGKGVPAKQRLVSEHLVVERKVGTKTEKRKLLELTQKGRAYVENREDLELQRKGRGGIVHQYWQYRLKELCEAAGWVAKRELFDADVYARSNDVEVAIEVAMGTNKREIEHVEKHLGTLDAVWIVCRDEAVKRGLEEQLKRNDLLQDKVTFRLLQDIPEGDLPT